MMILKRLWMVMLFLILTVAFVGSTVVTVIFITISPFRYIILGKPISGKFIFSPMNYASESFDKII